MFLFCNQYYYLCGVSINWILLEYVLQNIPHFALHTFEIIFTTTIFSVYFILRSSNTFYVHTHGGCHELIERVVPFRSTWSNVLATPSFYSMWYILSERDIHLLYGTNTIHESPIRLVFDGLMQGTIFKHYPVSQFYHV